MNKYNPNIHHRRSIRLKGYDYSLQGLYFITICCQDKICRFGHIQNNEMILNEFGQIAYNEWVKLNQRFSNIELDAFQIMPNHIHFIIALNNINVSKPAPVGAGFTPAQNNNAQNQINQPMQIIGQPQGIAPTVSDIIGAYKSLVTNACLEIYKSKDEIMGRFLQRNYYEHIIRNEQSYQTIFEYIINNPKNWNNDKLYIL